MIGKNVIEISANEFLGGMTTSPDTDDGGFSPETTAINAMASKALTGVLYAPANMSNLTDPTGSVIASCADPDSGIGVSRYFLTSSAKFYSLDTSYASTLRQTGAKTYVKTISDMVVFRNKLYATSTTDITEASGATLGTIDEVWWTTTKGKSALTANPHPVVIFEDSLWIGDGNLLHKWDGTTASASFLTLPAGQVIVTLAVEPSSGKMLISITEGMNSSATLPRTSKILTYDGFSSKVSRAVIVDDMATAMYPLGGTVFVTYGTFLGYWNGSGITFLYKFKSVERNADSLVYKHMITHLGSILYIADGTDILAFGDMTPGKKKFFIAQKVTASLQTYLDALFTLGSGNLGVAFQVSSPGPTLYKFDTTARTTGLLNFYSKKYKFPRPVQVREIAIEYANSVANGATAGLFTLRNEEKLQVYPPALTNDTGVSRYALTVKHNSSVKYRTLQLQYDNSSYTSVIAGVRRILIYFDVVE